MSDNISEPLATVKLDDSVNKNYYGAGCFGAVVTKLAKLATTVTPFVAFNYTWSVNFVRKVEDDKKSFVISVETTIRYVFKDTNILIIVLRKNEANMLYQEFILDKCNNKQQFEIQYDKNWPVDFEHLDVSAEISIRDINYYRSDWATEYSFRNINKTHDVILVVEETKFNLIKSYLATWSFLLDRLFFGNFKEKNETEVKLDEVAAGDFETILRLIHPQLLSRIDEQNVLKVLKLADRFEIPNLMGRCGEFLCNFDKCKNIDVMDRLELADNHNLVSLKVACFERVHKLDDKARVEFFEKNRRRIQKLTANTIKNLI